MHLPVPPFLPEGRMLGEMMRSRMFEDNQSSCLQETGIQYLIGY
jgi:hypothetical protein